MSKLIYHALTMEMQHNKFKKALKEGRLQIGLWSSLCSTIAAQVLGDSGFDWIVIDGEHAPNELPDIVAQMQALAGTHASAVVRPAWLDTVVIKRMLDAGAQTIIVPFVQNADQAALHDAVTRLKAVGKPAGILTSNQDEARRYIDWGYTFVAVGSDINVLRFGADALVKNFKL